MLSDDLAQAGPDLVDVGLAYVRSALAHPGHFDVMFRSDLLSPDAALLAAQERAEAQLSAAVGAQTDAEDRPARLAAWSIAHGFATLWRAGAFGDEQDAERLAREVLGRAQIGGSPASDH